VNKYTIRFNKSRGQQGRGSLEHVWRVFENDTETLARHVRIECRSWTELDKNGVDFNVACYGQRMLFYSDTDTVVILAEQHEDTNYI
tara:strand:+ start:188 stop:448 length:261 start_codon:yes stop_codon:yes gene_type:complete